MASNSILEINDVWQKISLAEDHCHRALRGEFSSCEVPALPARDVEFLPIFLLPGKMSLSHSLGQQKLLHDLANIELQAMELGLRTLIEFPHAHQEFREQLVKVVVEEAKHLRLCLQALEHLGGFWGKWPVHLGLYCSVSGVDTLLERIFVVHRYLESSGLDAGETILRRLSGVPSKIVKEVVDVIVREEIGHVDFGSRWFKHYCDQLGVDSFSFFSAKTLDLLKTNPRPGRVSADLRLLAGFTPQELAFLHQVKGLSAIFGPQGVKQSY